MAHVLIVGNGPLAPGAAEAIDAADLVVRFNDCRSVGPGGSRTDIVAVCNTGRPGKRMLEEPGWKDNPAVVAASAIWCVRDAGKYAAMRADLAVSHPELDDFCDDYTSGFAAYAASSGKDFQIIPASTHDALDAELGVYEPAPYVVPSSGAVVIADFLYNRAQPGDRITLAGFGHQGWEWHPWDAERRWVEAKIARNALARLSETAPRHASGASHVL